MILEFNIFDLALKWLFSIIFEPKWTILFFVIWKRNGWTRTYFRNYRKFSKNILIILFRIRNDTYEFWVSRRFLELRYRKMQSLNFWVGQLPLKIIYYQKSFSKISRPKISQLTIWSEKYDFQKF